MIEIPAAVWGIAGAIVASWGSVYINNRYQFKAQKEVQKENHERELKTKAFTETRNIIITARFLFLELHDSSPTKERDLFRQYRTPPEFFIWATNQTLQAVCDFNIAVHQERNRLRAFKRSGSIFKEECHRSFFGLADVEAKVIDCIRQEINISFDKEEYIKIHKAHYGEFIKIVGWELSLEKESDEQRQENR